MAIRTISFSAGVDGISPASAQFAGVEGEHNASEAVFSLSQALIDLLGQEDVQYRFEVVNGMNQYDTTPFHALGSGETSVSVSIVGAWAAAPGVAQLRLVIAKTDGAGEVVQMVYTSAARLKFESRSVGDSPAPDSVANSIDEALVKLEHWNIPVERAEAAAVSAEQAAQDAIAAKNSIIPAVGDIEFNITGTNPSAKYPGTTWVQWGAGRVPVGVDTSQTEFDAPGKTGGSKDMPRHTHKFIGIDNAQGSIGPNRVIAAAGGTGYDNMIAPAGTGDSGNLPPYITCYMWLRTA